MGCSREFLLEKAVAFYPALTKDKGGGDGQKHVSHLDLRGPPGAFYARPYNHTRRLRLKKLLYLVLSRSPRIGSRWRFHFRNRHTAVSEVKRPLRNRFGSEAVTNLQRLYVTAIPQRTQVSVRVERPCNGRGRWSKPTVIFRCGNL